MLVSLPYQILVEKNVKDNILDFLSKLQLGKKCAFVCGKTVFKIIAGELKDILSKNFDVKIIDQPQSVEKDILTKLSKEAVDRDFIIGIGGGRAIDTAKYIAFLTNKPWIAFPTILSHDGVVSSRASLSSNGARISVEAKEPIAIIADLEVIKNAPYRWIAAGAGDVLSNIVAVEDWKIAARAGVERYNAVIAELAMLPVRAISNHAKEIRERSYHGLEILLWSLICSGFAMNIYGSSRPCSGSEHNFSHALDELNAGALHGEQCALGSIIMRYLQGKEWRGLRNLMRELGLPTTAKEIGIPEETLVKALLMARDVRERYTILNEVELTEEKARKILKEVEII